MRLGRRERDAYAFIRRHPGGGTWVSPFLPPWAPLIVSTREYSLVFRRECKNML